MPTLSFKVSAAEAAQIRRAARSKSATLADYLRASTLPKPIGRAGAYRTRVDKLTGLPVTVTPAGIAVTSDQVRAVLADFP